MGNTREDLREGGAVPVVLAEKAQVRAGEDERQRTRDDLRLVLTITALLDLMAITIASIIGWNLRRTIFSSSVLPLQADSLIERAIPWVVVAWMVALLLRGAYTTRHFGAGPDEFRAVLVASFA